MASIYETAESLSSTFARRSAFAGLKANLNAGRSACMLVLGDSTGNGTDEWVYLLAQSLGASYPGHTIRHRLWNVATEKWDGFTTVQTGTTNSGSARGVTFDGTTSAYVGTYDSSLISITGDLDVRVKAAATSWATGGALAAAFGNTPNRAWRMWVSGTILSFQWSADGTNLQTQVDGSLSGLVTNGQPIWLRATLDVDNGAGGHAIALYRGTDGVTWTQIGSTTTRAGTTSIADTAATINVGARSDGAADRLAGTVYEVEVRSGIDGPLVMPTIPELLSAGPSTYNGATAGAPVLDIWNGSGSGYSMTDLTDSTRMPRMAGALGQDVTIVSCSHNELGVTGNTALGRWDTLIAHIRSRSPQSGLVISTQNPRYSPATFISQHAQRNASLSGYAAGKGADVIDTFRAFGATAGLVGADGVHPTTSGSVVWAAAARAAFDAAP